jgi:hypothetical protein
MAPDWREASNDERKLLYRVTKQLVDSGALTWDQLYERAFSQSFTRGKGYEDNFGSGKIARWRAALIYRWLRANFAEYADIVDREIAGVYGAVPEDQRWESFVKSFGEFGIVQTFRQQRQIQMEPEYDKHSQVQQSPQITAYNPLQHPVHDRIELNHPFYFQLTSPFAASAIGVQWVRGHWFALPLGGGRVSVPIGAGTQELPVKGGVSLYDHLLIEQFEAGLHRVVFLILPDDAAQTIAPHLTLDAHVPPHVLNEAADRIKDFPKASWRVLCVNLMFVASDPSGGLL